jgi:hypothetical protein
VISREGRGRNELAYRPLSPASLSRLCSNGRCGSDSNRIPGSTTKTAFAHSNRRGTRSTRTRSGQSRLRHAAAILLQFLALRPDFDAIFPILVEISRAKPAGGGKVLALRVGFINEASQPGFVTGDHDPLV